MLASPAPAGDLAFVTSQNADMVSVVDTATGQVLARTPIAGKPAPVVYDPAVARAYVVAADTGRLAQRNGCARMRVGVQRCVAG